MAVKVNLRVNHNPYEMSRDFKKFHKKASPKLNYAGKMVSSDRAEWNLGKGA